MLGTVVFPPFTVTAYDALYYQWRFVINSVACKGDIKEIFESCRVKKVV